MVIHQPRPCVRVVALAVGLALLAIAGYAAYRYFTDPETQGFIGGDSETGQLREERRRLTRELRAARSELDQLRGRKTFEAQSCEIDAQACEAVRKSAAGLESEVADLREQLAFYRNIVAPEQSRAGIRVLRMAVRPAGANDVWRYELVLVQPVRRDRRATGAFDFKLEGLVGKQLKTLKLEELGVGKPDARSFAFRSFQEFNGELKLPAGFLPSKLSVTLSLQEGLSKPTEITESFDWSRLVTAGKE